MEASRHRNGERTQAPQEIELTDIQALTPEHLAIRERWEPLVPALVEGLRPEWRMQHHAAQALVEVGKGWGQPAADDGHTTMAWDGRAGALVSQGQGVRGRLRGDLRLRDLELRLAVDGEGARALSLGGRTLAEAMGWTAATATALAGRPRQASVPAPDLPDHPIADGAVFESNRARAAAIEGLYRSTAETLTRLSQAVPAFGGARCWPHHFDLASLAVLRSDADGNMQRTLGVGLTPPDTVDESGYWYVGPWTADGLEGPAPTALEHGCWLERPGALPMAVLGVAELSRVPAEQQPGALARFLADAIRGAAAALDGSAD